MDVLHDSPFVASLDPILDKDGAEARVAVLKGTFDIQADGSLTVSDQQQPIVYEDEFLGEPGLSSVSYEGDGAFFKPATDIVVVGTAYAPGGKAVKAMEAGISIGQASKILTVTGDRYWSYSSVLGIRMTSPKPFVEMPLSWERAFGGSDVSHPDSKKHDFEARNPIGTGFCVTKSADFIDGLALPNIEARKERIRGWGDKPVPQGVGFVGRSWMPRRLHAGTYDESWEKTRMPILPEDFDYAFFNAAPADLVWKGYLEGGEFVRAVNLSPRGVEKFSIPCAQVSFQGSARNRKFDQVAPLDTVVVNFDSSKLILVWRLKYTVSLGEPADLVKARVELLD